MRARASLVMKLVLALLALSLSAAAAPASFKLKERVYVPRGWSQHAPAHPDTLIQLHIALPQPNFDALETHLYEVSDPSHSRYGEHLSKEEVEELGMPSHELNHAHGRS